jgi:hypothetical protein
MWYYDTLGKSYSVKKLLPSEKVIFSGQRKVLDAYTFGMSLSYPNTPKYSLIVSLINSLYLNK